MSNEISSYGQSRNVCVIDLRRVHLKYDVIFVPMFIVYIFLTMTFAASRIL